MDRNKVIKECEAVLSRDPLDAPWDLIDDTLTLLKEQEPVEPRIQTSYGCNGTWWYICGMCNTTIDPNDKYCHECGQAVKWDDL